MYRPTEYIKYGMFPYIKLRLSWANKCVDSPPNAPRPLGSILRHVIESNACIVLGVKLSCISAKVFSLKGLKKIYKQSMKLFF